MSSQDFGVFKIDFIIKETFTFSVRLFANKDLEHSFNSDGIRELLKKELYITYCRGSGPTPGACTLGVRIKHADDPEKSPIFIHRLLFCLKPAHKLIELTLSKSIPNGRSNS